MLALQQQEFAEVFRYRLLLLCYDDENFIEGDMCWNSTCSHDFSSTQSAVSYIWVGITILRLQPGLESLYLVNSGVFCQGEGPERALGRVMV